MSLFVYILYLLKYLGGFTNNKVDIEKQVNQFKCKQDELFCLEFSKKIITSKIKNQIVILKRYDKAKLDKIKDIIYSLNKYISEIENCTSINEAIGFEGTCARLYFSGISCLVPDEFKFDKRSKRPPKDPFNALISYGYSLLYNEIILALTQTGLNTHAGFMHQNKQGHAALASDLMEQWRCPIVDSLVMKLINNNLISISDFTFNEDTGGYYLSRKANNSFIKYYEEKIRSKNNYFKHAGYAMTFRQAIFFNIYELVKCLEDGNLDNFKTLTLR
ncbi:MAG: CRISPR-associated endonuclease Cas1 [Intestinibacter sp.]|uniref:CRISPR-associated endonuclease Cas1 n=1 Tax=Intestinibacter sp. TaxID=1965304 RepID=UPI002A8231BA|nr:CRISPR-associated endonuclease Cas1 [Intestinibacter sp.]MDY4576258.1 CRISPR-associated endonuclease Cas1 [Intestinibacter sp.]